MFPTPAWSRLLITAALLAAPGVLYADTALHEQIDRAIKAKLTGPTARRTTDAEFVRRVYLDFAGRIPSSAEALAFIADSDAAKRAKLIDRLLASADYARRMQQVISVWFLERRPGVNVSNADWNAYLQKAIAADTKWDVLVRDLIAADGSDATHRPAIRFFADGNRGDAHQLTKDIGRIFLGMNLNCSQCHDDPNVDDFKQADYFGIYAYVRNTQIKQDKSQKPFLVETVAQDKQEFQSVFKNVKMATGPRLPAGKEIEVPKFTKGQEFASPARDGLPATPKFRPRQMLAADLTAANNARFARSSVNYFWFLLMGRGLVHPLDMMHGANPPSHPGLLDELANDFVKSRFDVKRLLREIALSEAYQRSSVLPEGVKRENIKLESFQVAIPRPLSAEQLAFATMQATGQLERIAANTPATASKFTYKDYINGRIPPPDNLADVLELFSATFGSPPGNPEVEFGPSSSQALFLMNDKLVMKWLDPRTSSLVVELAKQSEAAAIAEELYLRILTRKPTAEEASIVADYLQSNKARRADALSELAWALVASAEFRFNN